MQYISGRKVKPLVMLQECDRSHVVSDVCSARLWARLGWRADDQGQSAESQVPCCSGCCYLSVVPSTSHSHSHSLTHYHLYLLLWWNQRNSKPEDLFSCWFSDSLSEFLCCSCGGNLVLAYLQYGEDHLGSALTSINEVCKQHTCASIPYTLLWFW